MLGWPLAISAVIAMMLVFQHFEGWVEHAQAMDMALQLSLVMGTIFSLVISLSFPPPRPAVFTSILFPSERQPGLPTLGTRGRSLRRMEFIKLCTYFESSRVLAAEECLSMEYCDRWVP